MVILSLIPMFSAHVYFKSQEMHGKVNLSHVPSKLKIYFEDMDTHIGDLHPLIVGASFVRLSTIKILISGRS